MKKYKVTITETLERVVEVEAEDYEEAVDIIGDEYRNGEIILCSDDYTGTDFNVEEIRTENEKYVKNQKDFSR